MHGRSLPRTAPRFEMRMVAQQGSSQHCSKTNLEDEGQEVKLINYL